MREVATPRQVSENRENPTLQFNRVMGATPPYSNRDNPSQTDRELPQVRQLPI